MSDVWGSNIKISIFGESHGAAIGVVIDGLPSGVALDTEHIRREMLRRAPGNDEFSTPRKEADEVEILSGVYDGKTTGSALCGIIRNTDTRSKDYRPHLLRPGHADFTAFVKYGGFSDPRGGGHFSGRLTAPLVFTGAIAKQILRARNVEINAKRIAPTDDEILSAKADGDSIGGAIECVINGVPTGVGAPIFGSVESKISAMMFSIPAVKAVEFGAGVAFAQMHGSEANDEFYVENGKILTKTNNNGGINGGISNGMPIVFRVTIKPTPSIAKPQNTVDIERMENTTIQIEGRHDPCIVPRAVVVIEAAAALCVLDLMEVSK
ncbi:MAG: chorismate synthase [Oscillospiraceae bacterium]|nr:chorismate synthase [Oscillospiraceae bacterium]